MSLLGVALRRLRRPWRQTAMFAAVAMLACGCGLIGGPRTVAMDVPDVMTVSSQDFSQGVMGTAYTCHGPGRHPAIGWSGEPPRTKSLALVMDDSSAPIKPYIYWVVFNIDPQASDIPAGPLPTAARQAQNSKGILGYDPPCPVGHPHTYRFTVYALGRTLRLPAVVSVKTAWTAIAQAAIARGSLNAVANP